MIVRVSERDGMKERERRRVSVSVSVSASECGNGMRNEKTGK